MLFYRRMDCLPADAIQPTVPRVLAQMVDRDNNTLLEEQARARARKTVSKVRRDRRDRGGPGPGFGFGGGFGPSFVQ